MKLARLYATSLVRLERSASAETLVANLTKELKAKGRSKLLPAILGELKTMQATTGATRVEAASKDEVAAALAGAKAAGIEAKEAVINPSLIKGWRAQGNGMLADHSAKRTLIDLYSRITN